MKKIIFVLLASLSGQTAAQATSLEEALGQAYLTNPTLQAQRAQLRQTDEGVPQALSGWRPTVIGTVQGGYESLESNGPTGTRQQATGRQDLVPRSYGVTVTQPLFRGFRTVAGTNAAEKRVSAGRSQLLAVEQDILLQAVSAYMNVYRDEIILNVNRKNVEALRQQLEAARARFDVGQTTRTDIAEAESRLARGISDQILADGNLTASRAIYQQIIGQAPDQLDEPSKIISVPESEQAAIEQSISRPELTAAKNEAEAAREDIRVAFGELLPEISIEGSFTRSDETRLANTSQNDGTVLGTLRVPLYQAGAPDSRVRQAKQRYSELLERINEQHRLATQRAIDAWRLLQTAEGQYKASQEQTAAAEIALEGLIAEQAVGARTVLDIFDGQQELRDAQVAVIRARTDEIISRYRLASAIGQLTAKNLALNVPYYDENKHYEEVRDKFIGWDAE